MNGCFFIVPCFVIWENFLASKVAEGTLKHDLISVLHFTMASANRFFRILYTSGTWLSADLAMQAGAHAQDMASQLRLIVATCVVFSLALTACKVEGNFYFLRVFVTQCFELCAGFLAEDMQPWQACASKSERSVD